MIKTIAIFLSISFILGLCLVGGIWFLASRISDEAFKTTPPLVTIATSTPTVSSTPALPEATSTVPVIEPSHEPTTTSTTTSTTPVTTPTKPKPSEPVESLPLLTDPAKKIILVTGVPFTTQAPNANWADPLQENGCEEAATLMAVYWARGLKLNKTIAEQEIIAMGKYEIKNYGEAVDTDATDTLKRLFIGYFGYDKAQVDTRLSKAKVINALTNDQLVILPTNGRMLKNPNFKAPGPSTHMLVVLGYDPATDEFITNDPGTRNGQGYRYPAVRLMAAVVDYPTGDHEVQDSTKKSMIIVTK